MKLESTPIDDMWDILEYTDTMEQTSYYARHHCAKEGERAWMMSPTMKCYHCEVKIPDHIQALMTLLTWR